MKLDIAKKYNDELKILFANIAFNEEFMYAMPNSYREEFEASDSTWQLHEFAVLNNSNKVIGYIKYRIDRETYTVDGLEAINFISQYKYQFGLALFQSIIDIFKKFNFSKINFCVIIGNPIEKSYDKFIKKINGRIVGYKEKNNRLVDGNLYDCKIYEVMKNNFLESELYNKYYKIKEV